VDIEGPEPWDVEKGLPSRVAGRGRENDIVTHHEWNHQSKSAKPGQSQ